MALADNIIDILKRRAAVSGLTLTESETEGDSFPRLTIGINAPEDERLIFSALSSAEAQAWLDGFEHGRALAPKDVGAPAGAELPPAAEKSVRDLLVGLSKRIEDHEGRLQQHEAWFVWLRNWFEGLGAIFANPFAANPFLEDPADDEEDAETEPA